MPLDATPSGMTANSYGTRTEADDYFSLRLNSEDWTSVTDLNDKDKALVMATFRLEQEEYDYNRTSLAQALKWPRVGVISPDGVIFADNVVPLYMKYAQFELALIMLKGDFLTNSGLANFRQMTLAGVISLTPRYLTSGMLPDTVQRWLVATGAWLGLSGTVRLIRS
jgi:hypothetical protein